MQKAPKPQLLKAFRNEATKKSVEVWKTSCIVTNFGKNQISSESTVLINPGNPELSGVSKFSYFPRGGPVPIPKAKWVRLMSLSLSTFQRLVSITAF